MPVTDEELEKAFAKFQSEETEDDDDDDDMFGDFDEDEQLTAGQIRKLMKKREETKAGKQQKYTNDYTSALAEIRASEDAGVYEAVTKVMADRFNVYRTGDGKKDCTTNYLLAKNAIIKGAFDIDDIEEGVGRVNPLSKNKDKKKVKTGKGSPQVRTEKKRKVPKLDKWASEFVRSTGMSADSVAKALNRG